MQYVCVRREARRARAPNFFSLHLRNSPNMIFVYFVRHLILFDYDSLPRVSRPQYIARMMTRIWVRRLQPSSGGFTEPEDRSNPYRQDMSCTTSTKSAYDACSRPRARRLRLRAPVRYTLLRGRLRLHRRAAAQRRRLLQKLRRAPLAARRETRP